MGTHRSATSQTEAMSRRQETKPYGATERYSMASSGSCARELGGTIYPIAFHHIKPATDDSKNGFARECSEQCRRHSPTTWKHWASSTLSSVSSTRLLWRRKRVLRRRKNQARQCTMLMAVAGSIGLPVAIYATSACPHEVILVEETLARHNTGRRPRRPIGDIVYDSDRLDCRLARQRIDLIVPHRLNRIKLATQDDRALRRGIAADIKSSDSLPGSITSAESLIGVNTISRITLALNNSDVSLFYSKMFS